MMFVIAFVVIVIVELKLMRASAARARRLTTHTRNPMPNCSNTSPTLRATCNNPIKANIKAACSHHQLCNKVASSLFFPVSVLSISILYFLLCLFVCFFFFILFNRPPFRRPAVWSMWCHFASNAPEAASQQAKRQLLERHYSHQPFSANDAWARAFRWLSDIFIFFGFYYHCRLSS